jgi:hypothetical protein
MTSIISTTQGREGGNWVGWGGVAQLNRPAYILLWIIYCFLLDVPKSCTQVEGCLVYACNGEAFQPSFGESVQRKYKKEI